MEEKKQLKISLGTAICIFIIIILVSALVGTIVYYNKTQEKNNNIDEKNIKNTTTATNIDEKNIKNTTTATNTDFVEGNYIRSNENEVSPSAGQIKFSKGIFTLTLGSFEITGKYDILDKNVKCNLENESFEGNEARTLKDKNWEINFEIIDDKKIRVISSNVGDWETELSISLGNFFYEGAECTLYDLNNFIGTWNIAYVIRTRI